MSGDTSAFTIYFEPRLCYSCPVFAAEYANTLILTEPGPYFKGLLAGGLNRSES